jgi:putative methyltransferase (TIGR04325 family)
MFKTKRFIKGFIPPFIFWLFGSKSDQNDWSGNYSSWREAHNKSTGYDSSLIVEKVKEALLKVKNGEAVYERDSVIFDKIHYSYPQLASLMWVAASDRGKLNIIDFGGSLGSGYFQNFSFLSKLVRVHWNVVEQPSFVDMGKKYFENEQLRFFYTIQECLDHSPREKPNMILLSSVLQYLENPYEMAEFINSLEFDYVLVDRTLFILQGEERLTIQKVPPNIYDASYPAWFFDKDKLLSTFSKKYQLVFEFESSIKEEEIVLIDNKPLGTIKGFLLSKI